MPPEESFCGVSLTALGHYYSDNISVYLDLSMCVIGSILNLFNLMVFTRKHMISPANLIFTHLAIVDFAVLLVNIPVSWHEKIVKNDISVDKKWSYQWLIICLCFNYFAVTLHSISVWLTVMLAVWRYIAVVRPLKEDDWCNMRTTRIAITIGYILCILLNIPMYFSHEIEIKIIDLKPFYVAKFREDYLLYPMVFIVNGALFKILPSIVLTAFSFRLIVNLISTKNEVERLTSLSSRPNRIKHQVDRSTRILLTVLALFLIAEVPIGVLSLLNVIRGNKNYICYHILGQIFDTITLINSCATFLVYCTMSQQFRATFKSLFGSNPVRFQKKTHNAPDY